MSRPLTGAALALSAALPAAIAAALLPSDLQRLSLGLFAFAVTASVGAAILLVADRIRRRSARRVAAAAAGSPLSRLEYLPAVTTGARKLQWQGGRYLVGSRTGAPDAEARGHAEDLVGAAQSPGGVQHLTGSGYPRPASNTKQPQIDEAEASPRAS
jgi:hypothetical protein